MIERVRKICLALPDAAETTNFGHPFSRVKNKPFCVFHNEAIAVKVMKTEQSIFLENPRFLKTPYMHHNGWVSLYARGRLDWKEIAELIRASYNLTTRPPRRSRSRPRD